MRTSIFTIAIAALSTTAAVAQTAPAHGLYDNVINKPGIGWGAYGDGQTAKQVAAPADVPGGQAVRFTVSRAAAHPYDVAATYASSKPIAKGDTVVAMVYMRAPAAKEGAPLSIPLAITETSAPYTQIASQTLEIGPSWKRYFAYGTAPKDFAPGKAWITVQLGGAKQVVELGAAFLLDPGAGFDSARLPHD